MALYAEGDGAAFRRLFELMAPRIRAFFLRSFSDAAVADDLTQATFLKLHSARVSYRADRPLKPWVFTIAAGPVVYLIARGVRRSASIDIDLAMRELPPE